MKTVLMFLLALALSTTTYAQTKPQPQPDQGGHHVLKSMLRGLLYGVDVAREPATLNNPAAQNDPNAPKTIPNPIYQHPIGGGLDANLEYQKKEKELAEDASGTSEHDLQLKVQNAVLQGQQITNTISQLRLDKSKPKAPDKLSLALEVLEPLVTESSLEGVEVCHTLRLDYEESNNQYVSHSTAYSCYRRLHRLYVALLAVEREASPDKWAEHRFSKLERRVGEDHFYFKEFLTESERDD